MSNSAQQQEKVILDSKWQPIETAPRDGTVILATWIVNKRRGKWTIQPVIFSCGVWLHAWDEDEDLPLEPTHWMPLPEPPTKGENK